MVPIMFTGERWAQGGGGNSPAAWEEEVGKQVVRPTASRGGGWKKGWKIKKVETEKRTLGHGCACSELLNQLINMANKKRELEGLGDWGFLLAKAGGKIRFLLFAHTPYPLPPFGYPRTRPVEWTQPPFV